MFHRGVQTPQTPRSPSKILRCASYFQISSGCWKCGQTRSVVFDILHEQFRWNEVSVSFSLLKPSHKIHLTNRVRGPYCKLRTEFFTRLGHKSKGRKRGSVTYISDRENEVSKIFIISLLCV